MSVGEKYLQEVDGPSPFAESGSSSMGVMGGGGVIGGEVGVNGLPRSGEDSIGVEEEMPVRGLRDRWERRDRVEPPAGLAGDPTPLGNGVISPPAARRMLPTSLPYAGGGASVPTLGASPHRLTFASMKTNPDWPRLT